MLLDHLLGHDPWACEWGHRLMLEKFLSEDFLNWSFLLIFALRIIEL